MTLCESTTYFRLTLSLIIEEHEVLLFFLVRMCGHIYRLHGFRIDARIVHLCSQRHRRWREVLNLLKTIAQLLHLDGQIGHIPELASGMGADEIRDQLITQPCLTTDGFETLFRLHEKVEGGFPHRLQDEGRSMLGGHFESSAHMMEHNLLEIVVAAVVVGKKIITDAATDKKVFHTRIFCHFPIEVDKRTMVAHQVGAMVGLYTRETGAFLAKFLVLTLHTVHIGGRATQIAKRSVEIGHLYNLLHLFHDRLLTTRDDLFALMGRDGTERTASETTTMAVDGEFDHLVGGDSATFLILRMGKTGVREIKRFIQFLFGERCIGRVDDHIAAAMWLHKSLSDNLIAFLLDDMEILSLLTLGFLTLFEGMKPEDIVKECQELVNDGVVDKVKLFISNEKCSYFPYNEVNNKLKQVI